MMITQISASCRRSHNYNSFEASLTASLTDEDEVITCMRELQARARKMVQEQIDIEIGKK